MKYLALQILLVSMTSSCMVDRAMSSRANIVFVLVDDLAWTDLGCYGHPWHTTPNIDQLSRSGMRFTQAYAPAPICSAARASILSGKTVARVGLEFVVKRKPGSQKIRPPQPLLPPPFKLNLALKETTIAEHLRDAGYNTAIFGKWHLNAHEDKYLGWSTTYGPQQQGFTTAIEDFGSHPYSGNQLETLASPGCFHPDGVTQKAIGFLEQDHHVPFFLMVSHFYVHTPIESPYAWLLEKYNAAIPANAENRKQRIEYAACVETLDHYVGVLLDAIREAKLEENTLVVFFSDNGGHPEFVSNKPLRGSKWNLYEGGIRVPMIVRWPGQVARGSSCAASVIGYDLFPTFAALAGEQADAALQETDGRSLLPLLKNPAGSWRRSLVWHFPYYHPEGKNFPHAQRKVGVDDFAISQTRPQSAIGRGDYKLIHFDEEQRSELYDLSTDISEQHDLSGKKPELQESLRQELESYLNSVHARRANPRQE